MLGPGQASSPQMSQTAQPQGSSLWQTLAGYSPGLLSYAGLGLMAQPDNLGEGLLGALQMYQQANAQRQQAEMNQQKFGMEQERFGWEQEQAQYELQERQRQIQKQEANDQFVAGLAQSMFGIAPPGGEQPQGASMTEAMQAVPPQVAELIQAYAQSGDPAMQQKALDLYESYVTAQQESPDLMNVYGNIIDPRNPSQPLAHYAPPDTAPRINIGGPVINHPKPVVESDTVLLKAGAEGLMAAQDIIGKLQIAEDAAKRFPNSGPMGNAALVWDQLKSYFGQPNDAPAGETLRSMQVGMAALQRIPGSGATTDYEMRLYQSSVPGLSVSQQGNIALAQIGQKLARKKIADFNRMRAYFDEHGQTLAGYVPDDKPVLSPEEMDMLLGASQGGGAAPPAGGGNDDPLGLFGGQ